MRTLIDFTPSSPGETEQYAFDFAGHMGPSETLTDSTWTIALVDDLLMEGHTADSDPSSRLSGDPSEDTPPGGDRQSRSIHTITDLQPGNTYRLVCTAVTSLSNSPILWAHVTCEPFD